MYIKLYGFVSLFLIFFLTKINGQESTGLQHDKKVVCFLVSWSSYRLSKGAFKQEDLRPEYCTHLVYAFAGLNASTSSIKSLDVWQDLPDNYGLGRYEKLTNLKISHPHLKVLLSIGGWNEGSENYSQMAADPIKRGKFVDSVVQWLRRFNFDGLDLDWEYPGQRGGLAEDKQNYVFLVQDLKKEFDKYNLSLTATVGYGRETINFGFNVAEISRHLDQIHMACYEYHGPWTGKVLPHSPLNPVSRGDERNIKFTIELMLTLGAPPEKLILGVPFYGRSYIKKTCSEPEETIGADSETYGFKGLFSQEDGYVSYNEICLNLSKPSSGWTSHWDDVSLTPYAVNEKQVIVYDNQKSLVEKIRYAIQKQLGGIMIRSIDADDFRGECADEKDTFAEYEQRLDAKKRNPFFKQIVPIIERRIQSEIKRPSSGKEEQVLVEPSYKVSQGNVFVRLPHRSSFKFPLLQTINEALFLTRQENIIHILLEKAVLASRNKVNFDRL